MSGTLADRDRQSRQKTERKLNRISKRDTAMWRANKSYRQADKTLKTWIDHVRDCGTYLNQAYKYHRHAGTWMEYLKNNFEGSYETATIYRRVARDWHLPQVQEALQTGNLNSISQFLSLSKAAETAIAATGAPAHIPTREEELRKNIVSYITEDLTKRLSTHITEVATYEQLLELEYGACYISKAAIQEAEYWMTPEHLRRSRDDLHPEFDAEWWCIERNPDGSELDWTNKKQVDAYYDRERQEDLKIFGVYHKRIQTNSANGAALVPVIPQVTALVPASA